MHRLRTLAIASTAAVAVLALTACDPNMGSSSSGNGIKPVSSAPAAATGKPAPPKTTAARKNTHTVVYEVTSDAAKANSVSYFTISGTGQSGQEQAQDAPLPFKKAFEVEGNSFFSGAYSLVAQASDDATTISCKITVDGKEMANQTSTGQFAVVTCSGS